MNFVIFCLVMGVVAGVVSAALKSFIKPLVKVKKEFVAAACYILTGALIGMVIAIIFGMDIDSNPVGCGIIGGTALGIAERLFICEKKAEE